MPRTREGMESLRRNPLAQKTRLKNLMLKHSALMKQIVAVKAQIKAIRGTVPPETPSRQKKRLT